MDKRLRKCGCRAGHYCAYHAQQAALEAGRLAMENEALARVARERRRWSNQEERLHPGYPG
jgi:hypothetical protein